MATFYKQSALDSNKYFGEDKSGTKIGNAIVMGRNPNDK